MCSVYQAGGHMYINRRHFSSRTISLSVFTQFAVWKHIHPVSPSRRPPRVHPAALQVAPGVPPRAVLPEGLPASVLPPRPGRCHALCFAPEERTQPYIVPICNSQASWSPEVPFTQTSSSLAASLRCIWILSGPPWARNLVWNSFSLQNFGSSASGAI